MVELHGLVELPALLKMHGTLDHQRRRGLEGISEEGVRSSGVAFGQKQLEMLLEVVFIGKHSTLFHTVPQTRT